MNYFKDIREEIAAGSFYPQNPKTLKQQIIKFLENVKPPAVNNIKAVISPHAGYIYSGQVAAYSYKAVEGKRFDSIFIIAPSHSEYFDFVSVYDGKAYRTPLGLVEIDEEKSKKLAEYSPNIKLSSFGHRNEHSLEVQLPFLQVVLGNIKIVAIVIGRQDKKNTDELGNAISKLFKDKDILIIASTDLSHYHNYDEAVYLDSKVIELVEKFDIGGLQKYFLTGSLEMCGGGPVISAMIASKNTGATRAKILSYQNSGDVTGDKSAVVGYLSAALYKE